MNASHSARLSTAIRESPDINSNLSTTALLAGSDRCYRIRVAGAVARQRQDTPRHTEGDTRRPRGRRKDGRLQVHSSARQNDALPQFDIEMPSTRPLNACPASPPRRARRLAWAARATARRPMSCFLVRRRFKPTPTVQVEDVRRMLAAFRDNRVPATSAFPSCRAIRFDVRPAVRRSSPELSSTPALKPTRPIRWVFKPPESASNRARMGIVIMRTAIAVMMASCPDAPNSTQLSCQDRVACTTEA